MENLNCDLLDFIEASPTPFHAVQNVKMRLIEDGYTELYENERWNIDRGGAYFVKRGEGSLIAFRIPEEDFDGFQIVASHTDSPSFKLKKDFELETTNYLKLATERYGGAVLTTWLDTPLSVAGKVVVREGGLVTKLVNADRDIAIIPTVAPHLTRGEELKLNLAVDFSALTAMKEGKDKLMSLVAHLAGVEREQIVSHELYLVNRTKGRVWGLSDDFISSPRLDDLQCVYTSLMGFLMSNEEVNIPVLALFNNEEVGSSTREGAFSNFLDSTLERIAAELCLGIEDVSRLLSGSFIVSADNAHAVHPNHPELTDQSDKAFLNGGIVIKHNANMRYITDAESEGIFAEICRRADVPFSHYSNRSDIAGGSTLGNIAASKLGLRGVDIGFAQLAMHSSYETAGALDTEYGIRAFEMFFSSHIRKIKNTFTIE